MDKLAFITYLTACTNISRQTSRLLASTQDCLHRSQERLALSRKLLTIPVYPYDPVPPHDPFDFSRLKAIELGH